MEEDAIAPGLVKPMAPAGSPPLTRTSKAPSQPQNRGLTPSKPDALKLSLHSSQRLPSAGLSAWEGDASQPSADLTEYLGKTNQSDGIDSTCISPTRATGPTSGDGNLTHALLLARKAAEGRTSTASSAGESTDRRSSQRSHASDGSGNTPAAATTTAPTSDERRRPVRLSRVSTSNDRTSSTSQQLPPGLSTSPGASPGTAEKAPTERVGRAQKGTAGVRGAGGEARSNRGKGNTDNPNGNGGSDAGDASDAGDGKAGSTANAESERLRGLLYSDDDDDGGGDEEYQDLMTADDEALFGGLDRCSGAARGGGSGRRATSVEQTTGTEADDEGADDSGLESPFQRAPNQRRISSRAHRNRVGSRGGSRQDEGATGRRESTSRGSMDSGAESNLAACGGSTSGLHGAGGGSGAGRAGGLAAQGSRPLVTSPGREQQQLGLLGGSGREGLDRGGVGVGASGWGEAAGYGGAVPALQLQLQVVGPLPQLSVSSGLGYGTHHYLQQQQQPHHHHPHYASIPMPQLGEGLRPAQPNRRLYFPCSNNRSPVRGSGYVVSPAAVRPTSPVGPAGRSVHSATSHQQGMRGVRRSASSSPTLAAANSQTPRPHSPHESHPTGAPPEPEETPPSVPTSASAPINLGSSHALSTGYTSTGLPQPQGALLVGQSAALPGGYKSGGAWMGGHGAGSSGGAGGQGSRFPPAGASQQFGAGQVYRSRPISRTTSSPGDDTPGGAAAAAAGGGGAVRNNSASAWSSRSGRQQQLRALSSATGQGLPPAGGSPGTLPSHMRDRHVTTPPIRPSTSPARTPTAATPTAASNRSPRRITTAAGASAIPVGTILGSGPLSSASIIETADGSVGPSAVHAAKSRALVVPAFPQYVAPLGIRHCGFKPLTGPGSIGGPASSSPYSVIRHKTTDDRIRSVALGKILASVTGKEQPPAMGPSHHDYSILTMHPAQATYGTSGSGGGGGADSGGNGGITTASLAPAASVGSEVLAFAPGGVSTASALQQQQQPQPQQQQQQAQRRGSLPHLPLSSYPSDQGGVQSASGTICHHCAPLHASMNGLALLGRSAASPRMGLAQSESVSAAASSMGTVALQNHLMQGGRGFGFDAARRAASHA